VCVADLADAAMAALLSTDGTEARRAQAVVLTGDSGAGKTTAARAVLQRAVAAVAGAGYSDPKGRES
jgi:myosin heavy subunit